MADLELVCEHRTVVGEGPVWDDSTGHLLFVDISRSELCRFDPYSGDLVRTVAGRDLSAVLPRTGGGWILAARGGLYETDDRARELNPLVAIGSSDEHLTTNDAKCDAAGRIWLGIVDENRRAGCSSLWKVEPQLGATEVLHQLSVANGLGWSPDGGRMYFIDSPTGCVQVGEYDLGVGQLSGLRPLTALSQRGAPDGLCVDVEGGVWVAFWGGSRVVRFAPDGDIDLVVELPVDIVTSCCFGGSARQDLYITTASFGLSLSELAAQSGAGGVFRFRAPVAGLAVGEFAG